MGLRGAGAVALVLMLVLNGCSDGEGGDGGARSPSTSPSPTATGGTTAVSSTTAPGGDYCTLASRYAKAFERFGQPGTAVEMRTYYRDATTAMDQAVPVAPSEIQPDLKVVSDGLKALVAGLDGIGYDFGRVSSLPPELIARLMSQQFIASSTNVAAYSRERCGIS